MALTAQELLAALSLAIEFSDEQWTALEQHTGCTREEIGRVLNQAQADVDDAGQ